MLKKTRRKNLFIHFLHQTLVTPVLAYSVAFLMYILPTFILIVFIDELLSRGSYSILFYIFLVILCGGLMYLAIAFAYESSYIKIYDETKKIRIAIAKRLRKIPLSYFYRHDISDISQVIVQDVRDIEQAFSRAMPKSIGLFVFLTVVTIILIFYNYEMGLAVVFPIVGSLLFTFLSKKFQLEAVSKYFFEIRRNSEAFQETIEMFQEIKSYNLSQEALERIVKVTSDVEKLHIKSEFAQSLCITLAFCLIRFSFALAVLVGAKLYIAGKIEIIVIVAYVLLAAKIIDFVESAVDNCAILFYVTPRIERIAEIFDIETSKGEESQIEKFDISFENVDFSYNTGRKVINDLSFEAKQGEVTALVGTSGCGKTTVVRLIAKLYDVDSGTIKIGGKDIAKLSSQCVLDKISIVFQDVILFNTSVMENIRIGRGFATDEEVMRAAKLANCCEFIEKTPKGFATKIGENGMNLSGGERQRLSIARAILKDSPIILLDEITAALDIENEIKLQDSLQHLIKGKTVIIISHRRKAVENADKIIDLGNL